MEGEKKIVLPIKIEFNVTETIKRSVFIYALLGKKVYLIDTGVAGAVKKLEEALQKAGRNIEEVAGILLTHAHPDHIGGIAEIKEKVPACKVYAAQKQRRWIEDIETQFAERPIPNFHALTGASSKVDEALKGGDILHMEEGITLEVLESGGHSAGSVSYLWQQEKALFTGDAVPVVTEAPIFDSLEDSIKTLERLKGLADVNCLYPAWDTPKREGIQEYIDTARVFLCDIQQCIEEVCAGNSFLFATAEEKSEEIYRRCMQGLTGNPLLKRSILAGINESGRRRLAATQKNLTKRRFSALVCENMAEARQAVSAILQAEKPGLIGFGNSQTVRKIGIDKMVRELGIVSYTHDPRNFSAQEDRIAMHAGVYFTSANAVSLEGHLINIDGTGNRTSATCFGPGHVVYIVGRNKIASGLENAMERAKQAAANLAAFYGKNTPCAKTGYCTDCLAEECICGVTTIHRKALIGNRISVVLVNEDLGI